jgi:hypothetical protein
MDVQTEVIFLRVPAEEKQKARELADQFDLSLTGLWRAMIADVESAPVTTWKPVLRSSRGIADSKSAEHE